MLLAHSKKIVGRPASFIGRQYPFASLCIPFFSNEMSERAGMNAYIRDVVVGYEFQANFEMVSFDGR